MINILYRDVLLNGLMSFMALVVILLLMINPPSSDDQSDPPGNLAITVAWDTGNIDVDLWILGPDEEKPVGYSNRSGTYLNLLRDDVGTTNDILEANIENTYTRGIIPGWYVINVHCFRCYGATNINLEVRMTKDNDTAVLLKSSIVLNRNSEEKTIVQFQLLPNGTIDPKTMHSVYRPLREVKK